MGFVTAKFLLLFLVALLVLAIQIAGAGSPWYRYDFKVGKVEVEEFLTYRKFGSTRCDYTNSNCVGDKIKTMYGIITACVIVAIVLTAIEALILFIWAFHFCKIVKFRGKLRIPLIIIAVLATVATAGAWLVLFWHEQALEDDIRLSVGFISDYSNPDAGWGLFLGASVISLILTLAIPTSGSPDHVGYLLFK